MLGKKRLVSETDFGQEYADGDEHEDDEEANEMFENNMQNTTSLQ